MIKAILVIGVGLCPFKILAKPCDVTQPQQWPLIENRGPLSCDLTGKNFSNKRISWPDHVQVNFTDVQFIGSQLPGASFGSGLFEGDFWNDILLRTYFFKANLQDAFFDGLVIGEETTFEMKEVVFERSNLINSYFSNVSFVKVHFKHSELTGANFIGGVFKGAKFTNSILVGATFSELDFLEGVDFTDANLRAANFFAVNFHDADLLGADFSAADLRWADLSNVKNISDVKSLRGAKFCPETQFPKGFDPAAAGMSAVFCASSF